MSCTFWLRRKQLAAQKQKEATQTESTTAKEAVDETSPDKAVRKPAKKGGVKNADSGTN